MKCYNTNHASIQYDTWGLFPAQLLANTDGWLIFQTPLLSLSFRSCAKIRIFPQIIRSKSVKGNRAVKQPVWYLKAEKVLKLKSIDQCCSWEIYPNGASSLHGHKVRKANRQTSSLKHARTDLAFKLTRATLKIGIHYVQVTDLPSLECMTEFPNWWNGERESKWQRLMHRSQKN